MTYKRKYFGVRSRTQVKIYLRSPENDVKTVVTKKGLATIIHFANIRDDLLLLLHLNNINVDNNQVLVHKECRKSFTDPRKKKESQAHKSKVNATLRSSLPLFEWKTHCFFCAEFAAVDKRHPDRSDIHSVTTLPFREKLMQVCEQRNNEWSSAVQIRLNECIDLVAAEAIYHKSCYSRFTLNKKRSSATTITSGRPVNKTLSETFYELCQWLDSQTELYALSELHEKMVELSQDGNTYSVKTLKTKLKEHYIDFIYFAEIEGKPNIVCFRDTINHIINSTWYEGKKENRHDEATRIIKMAAKIIRSDIRDSRYDSSVYPSTYLINDVQAGKNWLPATLKLFLEEVIKSEVKQASIGQCIVRAAKPRSSVPPLLFGLAVEMDHVFGSKWLVNELFRLGYAISYDDVTRYKQSVAEMETIDDVLTNYMPGSFTQWVADNIDHNLDTIDGKDTFHGMGVISVTTPAYGIAVNKPIFSAPVERKRIIKAKALVMNKGIPIKSYLFPSKPALLTEVLKPYMSLQFPYTLPNELNIELLWHSASAFGDDELKRPNWSGYMQHVTTGIHPPVSHVHFLPIINLKSSDESCIYSTLSFIESQASLLNIQTACITFDQPLWVKAVEITKSKSMNVVCKLGGFHMLMSYLGSVGYVMESSWLSNALETVYGVNAVKHMMDGKAYSRAMRGHILAQSALMMNLLRKIPLNHEETNNICDLFKRTEKKEVPNEDVELNASLTHLDSMLKTFKETLAGNSRTAKLWIQYMDQVDTIKLFTRAERTGNWNLHLVAVGKMLNLFAASGHHNYAKSGRLYLQLMHDLHKSHHWLFNCFSEHGYQVVRRSNRYWAGLWADLIIEQVMMRTIKSRGGLTSGRGMTDYVKMLWVASMHRCSEVHEAMTSVTQLQHQTSEQHQELGKSRINRDCNDLQKIQSFFQNFDPFDGKEKLQSISSGLIASENDSVNCDNSEEIGFRIQQKMDGLNFADASIKRKDKVSTLVTLNKPVIVGGEKVHIDSSALFSRLVLIVERNFDIEPYFKYELAQMPTALFNDYQMRKPNKSVLGKLLLKDVPTEQPPPDSLFVIDGGALLHLLKWRKGITFLEITEEYRKLLYERYGSCTVVFDGYGNGPSVKDHEHIRRKKKCLAEIDVKASIIFQHNQQEFLANEQNKSKFITLLSRHLQGYGHVVDQSLNDADTLIVKRALQSARADQSTVVVADNTDIVVLLLHHYHKDEMANIFFQSEATRRSNRGLRVVNIAKAVVRHGVELLGTLPFLHAWNTLRSETFAGRNFRGSAQPRNFCISREKTFADETFSNISREKTFADETFSNISREKTFADDRFKNISREKTFAGKEKAKTNYFKSHFFLFFNQFLQFQEPVPLRFVEFRPRS